jgi:hypothetical protein
MENYQKYNNIFDSLSKIWSFISALLTIGSATLTVLIAYWGFQIDNKLKDLEIIKKNVEINQAKAAFDREFKLKIYDLCVQALKQKDEKQEKAAFVAVSSLVTEDIEFRKGLLGLFSIALDPNIRKAANEAEFVIREDNGTKTEQPDKKVFVDIFYNRELSQTKDIAQKLFNALKFSSTYKLGVNIKPLTKIRNQERFYGVVGTQIRRCLKISF